MRDVNFESFFVGKMYWFMILVKRKKTLPLLTYGEIR